MNGGDVHCPRHGASKVRFRNGIFAKNQRERADMAAGNHNPTNSQQYPEQCQKLRNRTQQHQLEQP